MKRSVKITNTFRTLDSLIAELQEIRKTHGNMPTEVSTVTMSFDRQCMVVQRSNGDTCLLW